MRKILSVFIIIFILSFAVTACAITVNLNDPFNQEHKPFNTGYELYKAKRYADALEAWEKDLTNTQVAGGAALMIGVIYENGGNGITKDIVKALEYYEKSLALGYEPAKLNLSVLYLRGEPPMTKDLDKAYALIHDIENLDHELIPGIAYKFYLYGWGTAINVDRAKEIALRIPDTQTRINAFQEIKQQENLLCTRDKEAAEKNITDNQQLEINTGEKLFKEGMRLCNENKYVEAMITFKKAVEAGHAKSACLIGFLYNNGGNGITPSVENALKWFRKSQEMGYPGANVYIAYYYVNGDGVKQDYNKAYELIHEVEDIDLGPDDDAITVNTYRFYLEGWGTPTDYKKAYDIASRIHDKDNREEALAKIKQREQASRAIPVKTLISDVRNNQMRFDRDYRDKTIKCEGRVENVESIRNGYKLNLYYDAFIPNPFHYIECRFSRKHEADLLSLNKGDTVKVQGVYRGKQDFQLCAVVLYECQIVK